MSEARVFHDNVFPDNFANGEAVQFEKQRYLVLKGLLEDPLLGTAYAYAIKKSLSGAMAPGDSQVPGTPSCYGDNLMEMLLELFRPRMETLTGLRLHPTYSYFRVYKHGDVLEAHKDRPSCEISLTLTLGFEASRPWPIFLELDDQSTPVELLPGDAIAYRGTELKHWRERFEGVRHAGVFLHYVDRDGPYADWKYDKRKGLRFSVRRVLNFARGNIRRVWASLKIWVHRQP